jgi:hypothetical protein
MIGSINSGSSLYETTASPVELPDGHIRVGNITFHPAKVLGKGCEGTFVYQVTVAFVRQVMRTVVYQVTGAFVRRVMRTVVYQVMETFVCGNRCLSGNGNLSLPGLCEPLSTRNQVRNGNRCLSGNRTHCLPGNVNLCLPGNVNLCLPGTVRNLRNGAFVYHLVGINVFQVMVTFVYQVM